MLIDLYFSNYKFGIGIFLFIEEDRIILNENQRVN